MRADTGLSDIIVMAAKDLADAKRFSVDAYLLAVHLLLEDGELPSEAAIARMDEAREAVFEMVSTLRWLDEIGGLGQTVHERIRRALNKAEGRC